jgi:hypothetical protein
MKKIKITNNIGTKVFHSMKKYKFINALINIRKRNIFTLCAVLAIFTFGGFNEKLFSKENKPAPLPLFYIKTSSISYLSSNIEKLLNQIGSRLNLAPVKLMKINYAALLNKTDLMMAGVDISGKITIACKLDPSGIAKIDIESKEPEFSKFLHLAVVIPLKSESSFDTFLQKTFKLKKKSGYYKIDDQFRIKILDQKAILYNKNSIPDYKDIVSDIDSKIKFKIPKNPPPLFYYKLNYQALEQIYQISNFMSLFKGGSKPPVFEKKSPEYKGNQQPHIYPSPLIKEEWYAKYFMELYLKFSRQANLLSPQPMGAWIEMKQGKDDLKLLFTGISNLKNRQFLRKFIQKRQYSLSQLRKKGQIKPEINASYIHLTAPLGLKDFIETIEEYKSGDIFLIRDFYYAIFILTDFLVMEDTKEKIWKTFNGGFDFIVYDFPTFQFSRDINKYKFLLAIDTDKNNIINQVLKKIANRTKESNQKQSSSSPGSDYPKLKDSKKGYFIFQFSAANNLFLGANKYIFLIGNDENIIKKTLQKKPQSYYSRSQLTFPQLSVGKQDDYPLAFKLSWDKIRNKLFTSNSQVLGSSQSFLPNLDIFEINYFEREFKSADVKNGIKSEFLLKLKFK